MAHNHRITESFDYNAICDVCGFKYKASFLRKRWDGLMVCEADYEQRHIADFYATRNDTHILPYIRSKEGLTAYPHIGTVSATAGDGTTTVSITHRLTAAASGYYITNTATSSYTLSAWVKYDTENRIHTIFSTRGGGSAGSVSFGVGGLASSDNAFGMVMEGPTGVIARSLNNAVTMGTWHYVVFRVSAGAVTFWVDGAQIPVILGTLSSSMSANGNAIYLGRTVVTNNSRSAVMSLRDVRFWNRAISDLEIRQNSSNWTTFSGANTGLIAWWKLNDTSGTYLDSCTLGVAMDLTNATGTDLTTEYDYH